MGKGSLTVLGPSKSCFVTILQPELPLSAKRLHTVCEAGVQESGGGETRLLDCVYGARVLPEALGWDPWGFLLWKSTRLLIDINSTHETLAMTLREAVEREGNLILFGGE